MVKNLPAMWDTWVEKIPLEKGMPTYSSILAWEISWTEEGAWWATVHRTTEELGITEQQMHMHGSKSSFQARFEAESSFCTPIQI